MGFVARRARRTAGVDSADRDGDARLRQSKDYRGTPEAETELLSRESPFQQLVVHVEGRAASRVGVSNALGKQARRRSRSGGTHSRTDESSERARLADMARLSIAHSEVETLMKMVHTIGAATRHHVAQERH